MAEITKLGKYQIRGELGHGAMGVVYTAFDPLIERVVAVKTIRPDQLAGAQAKEILARFHREAQAAGRLTHPNIVSIYDFGEDAGVWYIAMEAVDGRELKDYFEQNQRFATADVVRILTQILAALGYSHRQGVVHRDIKPSNIFILRDGTAKVADFGIAHLESSELTQVGTVLGTPAYMSPEQILGLPVDGRSDLFSVGIILYQFLTGERPFTGNATITMRKVLEEDPLPPSRFNMQIPGAMDAVVRRALAKKPDERFQTAEEFAAALAAAAGAASQNSGETTLAPPPKGAALAATGAGGGGAMAGAGRSAGSPAGGEAPRKPQRAAIAIVAVGVAVAIGAGLWLTLMRGGGDGGKPATVATAPAPAPSGSVPATATAAAPATAPAPAAAAPAPAALPVPPASPPRNDPGTLVITAVGLVDPSEARYQGDRALLQSDLRADSRSQLVAKAVGLLVDPASVAKNYDVLRDRLLAKSGDFVTTVVRESAPETGKDGLVSLTTEAVVNLKAVQKSLNEMSRSERIDFIRASGDPRVAVRITTRDADAPNAPPQPSPIAENILKERIKSFGFRTWSESDPRTDGAAGPDFVVEGEAKIKRLSLKLEASGLVVTKYALNSWTIKCIDRATGEEIYYNTKLPAGEGSWPTEDAALKAIGAKIAAEFSRDFFLQHVYVTGRRTTIKVDGVPTGVTDDALRRELTGLPAVITVTAGAGRPRTFVLELAGSGTAADLVAAGILKPLNAKLGQACFTVGAVTGDEVGVAFDARCGDAAVLARLETNPPAGLYGAPPGRQRAVVKNPETLKKLMI
ncbi:MAG: protein kinase [Burkholderiales bacterium]|nr:protein kinase [Burkholderiales bacterium]